MSAPRKRLAAAAASAALLAVATTHPAVAARGSQANPVRAWEETVVLPTYPLRPDDPNPQFLELNGSIIYPYTMQDGFSSERVDRSYRAVFLENEYLRVMCLPEIGGRIHSVYDKVRGEEMFHVNRVIKPGHIALRGAWVSGGVEWNRGPQGHTVTSFSPVDVVSAVHRDGSASLIIGNTEMSFRTGWTVRLTLHPGKAYLDERIELFNPTDGVHPYYFWNNTAFPQRDGTRFIYPMSLGSDHDGVNFFAWPRHEGRDLTWLKNYPGPTSVFGYRVAFDFFGAYDVDRDFGIVQVADHLALPGKKAWTWGQSDAGMVAQSSLTDDDGPYIEVQSGPLPTQADFAMLLPGQRVAWQEFWYPVGGLVDGFEYATRDIAVQRREASSVGTWNSTGDGAPRDGVELRIVATGRFAGTRLHVSAGERELVDRRVDLEPGSVEVEHVPVAATTPLRVALRSADGAELLRYVSPPEIPAREPTAVERPSGEPGIEELFRGGYDLDKKGDRGGAAAAYRAVLALDPGHSAALRALAVLDAEAGRYESARRSLDRALQRAPEDGMVLYLRGVANLRLGELDAAVADGTAATMLHGSGALGHGLVGRARLARGDATGALAAFEAGLETGGSDSIRLNELRMLAAYGAGDRPYAASLARRELDTGSVRLVPWAVAALAMTEGGGAGGAGDADVPDDAMLAAAAARFAQDVGWLGEPEFAVLELAFLLADGGLPRQAAAIVAATLIAPPGPDRPLPLYVLAFLEHRLENEPAAMRWLERAASASADYVFPSRPEMIPILRWAVNARPDDGRARLYLGNLYAGLGRLPEAAAEWRAATVSNPSLGVAHRNLGLLAWKRDADLEEAADRYRRAIAARPDDQTLVRDLAEILLAAGDRAAAIAQLEANPVGGDRRPDVVVLLASAYVEAGRYHDAIDLLEATTFTNREGVRDTWEIFARAHIERGIERLESAGRASASGRDAGLLTALADFDAALTYPRNLNAGRPHQAAEARAQYWRGRAWEAMGETQEAQRAWRACAAGTRSGTVQSEHVRLCEQRLR